MKKLLTLILTGAMTLSLAACSQPAAETAAPSTTETTETAETTETTEATDSETIVISVTDAEGNPIDVEFPKNPERIVVLNWNTLDFLDSVGLGDKIVGTIKGSSYPSHLAKYMEDDSIQTVGSGLKDIDMEAVMSLEPDIIFSSDRTESQYEEFTMIAPTMAAYVDYSAGFMTSFTDLANKHAAIFDVEGELNEILADYNERIAAIADFAGDQTALLGIFAGGLNTLGNEGRASIVVNEMGFTNLKDDNDVNHGDASSYDAWLAINPDWMFVLDKDTGVGTEGAVAAKEQLEVNNPIIAQTDAFKNGQIVYLEPATTWYVADGGITSLDHMITSIEVGVGLK